jgi:hypothetical protein
MLVVAEAEEAVQAQFLVQAEQAAVVMVHMILLLRIM